MSDSRDGTALLDLEFPVEVWLTAEDCPLERLLSLEVGGVLPLERDPDGLVDLVANGSVLASGELVVVDGRFGFRVTANTTQKLASLEPEQVGGPES